MTIHYLHKCGLSQPEDTAIPPVAKPIALGNALSITQRSPGWNNRKPDIVRVQLGYCTLLAVPYRRWAWRRYELRVAEARSQKAPAAAEG
jgi:hypothetical protein